MYQEVENELFNNDVLLDKLCLFASKCIYVCLCVCVHLEAARVGFFSFPINYSWKVEFSCCR